MTRFMLGGGGVVSFDLGAPFYAPVRAPFEKGKAKRATLEETTQWCSAFCRWERLTLSTLNGLYTLNGLCTLNGL